MVRSMTGYGKAEVATADGTIVVEIRAVNHRYGEVNVKLPRALLSYENDVRKRVAERMKRGKIDVLVQYEALPGTGLQLEPDVALARSYFDAYDRIRQSLDLPGPLPLSLVLSQRDVLVTRENQRSTEGMDEDLATVVGVAVEQVDTMRLREGASLIQDIMERRELLTGLIRKVAERSPEVVREYSDRLKDRIAQLAGEVQVDEARLAQEIAFMADRCDITEELVRFNSHLQQFDDILTLDEPVGRKLDFLMQEFNREINTIGSKANDSEIASLVVQVKAELERIREQVQNIE